MRKFACIFVALFHITALCAQVTPQNPAQKSQLVESINNQLSDLTRQKADIEQEIDRLERQSLTYMPDDYQDYSRIMQQIQEDHKKAEEIEKQIEALSRI